MKKVPKCEECDNCKEVNMFYKSFYCEHSSLQQELLISVDRQPRNSPKWCALRKAIQELKVDFIKEDGVE